MSSEKNRMGTTPKKTTKHLISLRQRYPTVPFILSVSSARPHYEMDYGGNANWLSEIVTLLAVRELTVGSDSHSPLVHTRC